jgi:hypothetical protein
MLLSDGSRETLMKMEEKPPHLKRHFVASNNRAENSYTQALLPIVYNN